MQWRLFQQTFKSIVIHQTTIEADFGVLKTLRIQEIWNFLIISWPNGSKCQFEPVLKNSNSRWLLQSAQQYGSKSQFENGSSNSQFEPFTKITQVEPEKEKIETEIDKFNCEDVVTDTKIVDIKTSQIKNKTEKPKFNTITTKTTNEKLKTESREEPNANIESNVKTKNKQTTKTKIKNKTTLPTIQKFSNHIKFIDYIPTHELITYRHLFAYGFYVE